MIRRLVPPTPIVPVLLRVSLVLLFLAPAAPVTTAAQGPPAGALEKALARVPPGSPLRIAAPDFGRPVGVVHLLDEGALHLRTEGGTAVIPLSAIDTLWVRDRSTRRGFLVGALLGTAVVAGVCIETFDECGLFPGIPVAPLVLGGFGAVAGHLIRRWDRWYP